MRKLSLDYVKRQAGQVFYIVDAGMTDLLRPALYDAHHEVLPLRKTSAGGEIAQLVGPVCELHRCAGAGSPPQSNCRRCKLAYFLTVPKSLIQLMTTGAYGMAMASTYNARALPAEVVVDVDGRSWRTC